MLERFEEIFADVMEELNKEWYEVYENDNDFEIVENRISAEFGKEVFQTEEWKNWVDAMYWDL